MNLNMDTILTSLMQTEQLECPLCEEKLELKNIGNSSFLCCPNFERKRCMVKVGLSKYSGPCRGCYKMEHEIQKDDITWFWKFTPFNQSCAHDRIFEILKMWNKNF